MLSSFWIRGLIFISVVFNPVLTDNDSTHSKIKLLFVVARHADRTPDKPLESYPTDPYRKRNFNPPGHGKLTESGETRELNLGKFLRKTYDHFLGPKYIDGCVEAKSTALNRTQESLRLILKGLYPGAVIPTKFESKAKDSVLFPQLCPAYMREYLEARLAKRKELEKLKGFMKKLSKWTGKDIDSSLDMYLIYTTLEAEKFMNLKLPGWTNGVYPNGDLLKGAILEFDTMNSNKKMRKRSGGRMIKKIKESMEAVKSGKMDKKRKLILYAAHDLNIVAILKGLDVYSPHVPQFSSAVIIELHQIKEDYYVKVNYYLGVPAKMKTLTIPKCKTLCPLDEFSALVKKVIPSGHILICDKMRGALSTSAAKTMKVFKNIFSR